jgi:hypothetical protein
MLSSVEFVFIQIEEEEMSLKREWENVKPRHIRLSEACWQFFQLECYRLKVPNRTELFELIASGKFEIREKELNEQDSN